MAEVTTAEAPSPPPSEAPAPAPAYANWKPKFNPWIVALTVTMATFMEVLDTSIANVALPHIAGGLAATPDEATWVLTSYLVSNAVILPLSGWLSTIMGRKRFYMTCVAIFTASSFLCGLAPSLGALVLFRILQGLGGGGLATSEQAILADTFSLEKRGMAFAVYGMAIVLAPAIGPTMGGWITDNFSWRWIFYINVPVGLLSLYLTNKIVEDPPYIEEERRRVLRNPIDYRGIALVFFGIGCLQYVLDKGQEDDWFASRLITTLLVTGVVCLVLFVWNEWKHDNPVVDVRMLRHRNFATAAFFMFVLGAVLYGTTVLIPQFLEGLMGYTAENAGKALSLGAFLLMFMMPVVGRLVTKVDPRFLIAGGFTSVSLALLHMTILNLGIDFHTAVMMRVYQTVGMAFIFIPISTMAYIGIPRHKSNQVAGINNLMRNLGGSVGISMLSTFLIRLGQKHRVTLVAHATNGDPAFTQRVAGLTQAFTSQGFAPNQARSQALAVLDRTIDVQSATLAYVDIISVMAVATLCLVPFVVLMRRPKGGAPQSAPAH